MDWLLDLGYFLGYYQGMLLIALIFNLNFALAQQPTLAQPDPLAVSGRIEPYKVSPQQSGLIILELSLPPKFHAYSDQFKINVLRPDGIHFTRFSLTPEESFYDKFSKKQRRGIHGKATLTLPVEFPAKPSGDNSFLIEVQYQACSDTFCLFPKKKEISIPFEWADSAGVPNSADTMTLGTWSGDSVKKALEENLFLAFVLVFLSGILTSFTPCIFPMIPITLAILGHDSQNRSRAQNFILSIFYVVGIATTYSILGVAAASSGALFGANLGHPLVIGFMCVIFFVMALSMYGAFEFQVPAFVRDRFGRRKSAPSFFGAYISGIFAGVVASPCVGPVLVTLLAFVASSQNKFLGFFLLFTYAIGLGMIFLLLGAFTELTRRLPRSGAWMDGMKFLLGSFMLGAFYYYLSFLVSQRWFDGVLGLGLVILALAFGAAKKRVDSVNPNSWRRGFMQGLMVVGVGFVALSVFDLRPTLMGSHTGPVDISVDTSSWSAYSDALLAQAKADGKPVVVDFFADWCLACHELDEKTFSDAEVKKALAGYVRLRFDSTTDTPLLIELRKKYKIMGLPTVIFFNSQGQWLEGHSMTEFEKPAPFLKRLESLRAL